MFARKSNKKVDNMDIMLILDDNYCNYALPFIYSVIKNNIQSNIVFHVVTCKMSQLNRQYLTDFCNMYQSTITFYDVKVEMFDGLKANDRYPSVLYYKLLPHYVMPKKLQRILYMDIDMIVTKSLQDLYNTDLKDNYLGACYDINPFKRILNNVADATKLQLEYVNSGTVLYNLQQLRKDNITLETYTEWLKNHKQTLYEEQLLNNALLGRIHHFMPFDYNFNIGERNTYKDYCKQNKCTAKKAIIHYMPFANDSPIIKPWNAYSYFYDNKPNNLFIKEIYELYQIWWDYTLQLPACYVSAIINQVKYEELDRERNKWQNYSTTFKNLIVKKLTEKADDGELKLVKVLRNAGYNKIAIYSDTEVTKTLLPLLKDYDIVEYVVENHAIEGFTTYRRDDTTYPNVDLMLIADIINFGKIEKRLKGLNIQFPFKNACQFLKALNEL